MSNILSKCNAQKWANALRSGDFKQSVHNLNNSSGYCCLGVACDIFIPKDKQERYTKDYYYGGYRGCLMGTIPQHQEHAPDWLKRINGDLEQKLGRGFSNLNDIYDFSFDEIADIIELVYVHKALD